jgi:hypothetical protein
MSACVDAYGGGNGKNAELCIRSAMNQAPPYEGPWRHFGYKGLD